MLTTQGSHTTGQALTLTKTEYWHRDHLGSLAASTNEAGAATRYAYDPFGKRRHVDGNYDASGALVADYPGGSDRGFTGHEHLDDVGIIHMNGRLYDPHIGRFLQADPILNDLEDLQMFNLYSYVGNNPLNATDPSGNFKLKSLLRSVFRSQFFGFGGPKRDIKIAFELIRNQPGQSHIDSYIVANPTLYAIGQIAATAATFYVCGGCGGYAYSAYYTYLQTGSANATIKQALITYATAQAFWVVGEYAGPAGSFGNVLGHAAVGCVSSEAQGGNCGTGALSAAIPAAVGTFSEDFTVNLITKSVIGGTVSVIGGGRFGNGAVTAAFGYLFNHCGPGHGNDCFKGFRESLSDSPVGQLWSYVFGSPRETALTQTSLTVGGTAMYGAGVSVEVGPVVDSAGKACFALTVCGLAGPGAGVTFDRSVNYGLGSPSSAPGANLAVFGKWAVPLGGGFEFAPGYGTDGLNIQVEKSRGIFTGGGVKACVQVPLNNATGGPC